MKIKKSPSKKLAPLPRQLSDLIHRLETAPEEEIPSIVRELNEWPFARGDMFYWVTALDRFDVILSTVCTEYNLKQVQTTPFSSNTKALILAIIDLARILFENCTNRNIYNSYEYLSMLLNTFDIDVLRETLHFMIRPAQRLNNPKAVRSTFVVPQDRIIELARGWSNVPVELLHIAKELDVTPGMKTLNLQFYRTDNAAEGHQVITYQITDEDMKKDDIDIFLQLVKEYNIPTENQPELANRIRIAKHIDEPETRRKLLGIRILAMTVMSHGVSEPTSYNKVFVYEPYLLNQLAELVSPAEYVDHAIQTFVFYALDAIARNRNKTSEILTSFNASANHGTLMQILRKTNSSESYPQPFLDSFFTFLSCILPTQPGGQMLMTAGIIPVLVQIVGNQQHVLLKNVAKVVGLVDTIVNSFSTSFTAFCNANGLDVLLNRIKLEIDTCATNQTMNENDMLAPPDRLSAIKSMLKFLLRMMGSSGTTDGLRNLIDSTLPQSLKFIMENPKIFGNSIFALSIDVSTTLIHNEPTSLPILQEAKLPQSFLQTISSYESPNYEVLMAAVNAFGAMCLNTPGLDMFNREKPLPHFFELMTSHEFLRNPIDIDSATGLGSTMDELIRHHPSLKPEVFKCVTVMIKKVLDMGSDMEGIGKSSDNSHLLQVRKQEETSEQEDDKPPKVECLLVSFIDLVARFLEGLFQNQTNIKDFVEEGCPEMLLNYFALPLLPVNFSATIASDSLSYLFRMISEASPLPTVFAIVAKVKESIRYIQEITPQDDYNTSIMHEFVDVDEKDAVKLERGNKILKHLIQLHGYVGLLSNICCSSVLSHGKNGVSLVTEVLSEAKDENIITLLGQLHRVMTWENLLLSEALPLGWYTHKSTVTPANPRKNPTSITEHPLGIYSTTEISTEPTDTTTATSTTEDTKAPSVPPAKDARMLNIKHFKTLLTEVPQLLTPIFQGFLKASISRRTGSMMPKTQVMQLAEYMSNLLKLSITWPPIAKAESFVCKYTYLTSIYNMALLLFRDERSQTGIQAPLAIAFERQGGVTLLLDNMETMWHEIMTLDGKEESEKKLGGCIESLLNILLFISSPKSLRDSPYTTNMVQKDKTQKDYFDPYEWVVSMDLQLTQLTCYMCDPQLYKLPKPVGQVLIKTFQQIMKGEGEFTASGSTNTRQNDVFGGGFTAPVLNSPFTLLRTPVVAAERHIQTLVDMGFERTSAEQALVRCNNQVSRAVDYLFSHPTPMFGTTATATPPPPQPVTNTPAETTVAPPEETHSDSQEDDDEDSDEDDTDEEEHWRREQEERRLDMEDTLDAILNAGASDEEEQESPRRDDVSGSSLFGSNAHEEASTSKPTEASVNADQLKIKRDELCDTLPKSLLALVDERDDLVFDVRDLLVILAKYGEKLDTATKIMTLLTDQIAQVGHQDTEKHVLLSKKLRLLAMLLREPPMQSTMHALAHRFTLFFDMLQFERMEQDEALPPWSATVLLVLEAFIAQADEPRKVTLVKQARRSSSFATTSTEEEENDADPMEEVDQTAEAISANVTVEQRDQLLNSCVSLLRKPKLSRDDIYAILRMIVRLTKDHACALEFVRIGGVPLLFAKPQSSLEGIQGQQAFIILILRHIVESHAILTSTMKDIITNWFTNPRPRNTDMNAYVRGNAHVALREPKVFVQVTADICRLTRYDEFEINRQIKLKKTDQEEKEEEPSKQPSSSEFVIHYLLNEIMTVRSQVTVAALEKSETPTEEQKKEENIKFVYTGFLLQCLVELISSYASCKYDIFNFCKKENGHRTTTADGKHRSFVSMLINDLLPCNHIHPSSEEAKKQQGLSTWTASTLVAMSYDGNHTEKSSQQKNELVQVRKYVLEAIVRSLKEAVASTETASVKYSKYLALADLCHRILNARPNIGSSIPRSFNAQQQQQQPKEDAAISTSKIMLDKNFVAILTQAVSDIDINYPHFKTILGTMLRPLEQLTKLAIKTEGDEKDTDKGDDKMDTAEEGMHVPSTDNEDDAPDLYRNSALGMFNAAGSVNDEDEYNSGEYSDMFGSSADEEEFDEDSGSDLSDMSEGDEDDDQVDEEMEAIMHGRGYDSDEMDEDDDNPDDIDAEAQLLVEEDEEDDEENGREMTWQLEDIEEESGIVHAENVDGDEEGGHLRNLSDPYDEEDEMDALSDFDDASDNLDNESEADITEGMLLDAEDLDTPFLPTELNDDLIMEGDDFERARTIIPPGYRRRFPQGRRSLLEGIGRVSRNLGNTEGQEDIITHPLLSNGTSTPSSNNNNAARSVLDDVFSRRGHGTGLSNWQDFEDIIGGSAVRMLENLLTNAPPASQTGPLRVDVQSGPGGALRTFEFDRVPHGHTHASSGTGANQQSMESLAILHDFQPMSSGERWTQEARMMFGADIGEKALKLVNEILNILIPIAIEDDKKARAEEEKKRQEQRRKEEEERRKAEEEKWRLEKEKRKAAEEALAAAAAAAAAVPEEPKEEPVVAPEPNAEPSNPEPEPESMETERTTVLINGLPVDISGTGIDVEFLEALPDELREEVLNQHLRNRPAPVQPVDDDSISPEFLDALPPDIREEVIRQEAIERERRERQSRLATSNTPASVNTPITGTNTTTTATPSLIDDATSSRRRPALAEDDTLASGSAKKKAKPRRRDGAAQLVEKSQLGTLVRLLFIPHTAKSLLNRLLLNLCENSKTRGDLLSYLVCVLYDGNNDLSSVDASFALMSSGKNSGSKATTQAKSSKATVTEIAPNFIAQRCLEALTYIVSCNEQSMTYFLTESESLSGLRRNSGSKKGKGKDKVPVNWNKYPILVLMSLLDRPVFINNASLMEQLMDLLSTMCRPFPVLVKKYQEKVENKQKDPSLSERPMPKPPTIPDYYLKLVVHVLTSGECSSKTFQYTLNAISHLSALEGAQQTIVNELMEDAKQSGAQILKDLGCLFEVLKTAKSGTEISSTILSPFSAATSYQAKLLRVLKTLDYMFSRKINDSAMDKAAVESLQSINEKRLLEIYKDLEFLPLWNTLGECLSVIREKEELINVATVLLPLIESFMVVSRCTSEKGQTNSDPTTDLITASPESFFFVFTEKHKKVLNIMVRNNPTLMSGSFALLVRNPKMLEFDNKRNYFVQQLHKRVTPRENYAMLQLNVRRQYVFEDSYHQLQGRTGEEFKNGKLAVRFYDEEGMDAGGVTREWFSVLARQMFDPNYALFITSAADKLTYQPNRDSAVNPDHLSFFKFVGRVIGKAVYDGRILDAYFTRSFYKHILGRTVDYRDVEALDPAYYKSLVWMLENEIDDVMDLTFSIETDFFGTKETVDLKPDGRNIPVTDANKHEYVTLVSEQKLTTAIKDQINAFVQGFHDVIPASLIQIFNEQELELLISGLPDIDIDDWKNNTEYVGYSTSSAPIQWFWRAVRSFDQEERAKLLQFATGTSKVPLEGFSQLQGSSGVQKFQIHKEFGGGDRLPSAHTCYNQIDLPQYDSYEKLRANLFKAISECSTGFAFV